MRRPVAHLSRARPAQQPPGRAPGRARRAAGRAHRPAGRALAGHGGGNPGHPESRRRLPADGPRPAAHAGRVPARGCRRAAGSHADPAAAEPRGRQGPGDLPGPLRLERADGQNNGAKHQRGEQDSRHHAHTSGSQRLYTYERCVFLESPSAASPARRSRLPQAVWIEVVTWSSMLHCASTATLREIFSEFPTARFT